MIKSLSENKFVRFTLTLTLPPPFPLHKPYGYQWQPTTWHLLQQGMFPTLMIFQYSYL